MSTNKAASISKFSEEDGLPSANNHRDPELTPANGDEEELAVLSPRVMVPPRTKYRSLPMVLFIAIAIVAVALFAAAMVPRNTPNSQEQSSSAQPLQEPQEEEEASSFGDNLSSSTIPSDNDNNDEAEEPNATSMPPSVVVENDDPYPKCPPPSTKPSDVEFLQNDLGNCYQMTCIAEVPKRNTRDRLAHSAPLCYGQALCNQDEERFPHTIFQFGLSPQGHLVWQQCNFQNATQNQIVLVWENEKMETQNNLYFSMTPTANWQIHKMDDTAVVWEQAVQNQPRPIQVTPQCLSNNPVLDCPYLHFRRHGDIVMNYVDPQDGWVACKSRKICYADLWQGK